MKEVRSKGCRREKVCKTKTEGKMNGNKGRKQGHAKNMEGEKQMLIFDFINPVAVTARKSWDPTLLEVGEL